MSEARAYRLSLNRSQLEAELRERVATVRHPVRSAFTGARFDFEGKRLMTACGRYTLNWRMRRYPDIPPGEGNRQQPTGYVELVEI